MMRIIAVLCVLSVVVTQQHVNVIIEKEEMLKVAFLLLKLGHEIAPEPLKKLLLFQVGEEIAAESGPIPALSLSVVVNQPGRNPIHVRIQQEEILKVAFFLLKLGQESKEGLKVAFLLLKLGLEIAPNPELNDLFLKLGEEIASEPGMKPGLNPVLRVLSLAVTQQGLEPVLVQITQEEMFNMAGVLYKSGQDVAQQPGEDHGSIPIMNEEPSQNNGPTVEEGVLAPSERCRSNFDCFPVCSEYGYCQKYGYKAGGSGYSDGRDQRGHGGHDQRGERADRGSCRTDADCWPVCSEYGYCQRSGYKPGDKGFPHRR